MDVMSPSKDALGPPYSIDYWFYYIIMLCEGVRAEKQKGDVTKCHLVSFSRDLVWSPISSFLFDQQLFLWTQLFF